MPNPVYRRISLKSYPQKGVDNSPSYPQFPQVDQATITRNCRIAPPIGVWQVRIPPVAVGAFPVIRKLSTGYPQVCASYPQIEKGYPQDSILGHQ